MFCDLVDSTSMSAKLDAEEWRDLVGAYLDAASEAATERTVGVRDIFDRDNACATHVIKGMYRCRAAHLARLNTRTLGGPR
jgi:hypothetical protein